jgi:hypothetical protein
MASRTPLVLVAGQVQQLQPGDAIAAGPYGFPYTISSNTTISAGYSVQVSRVYPLIVNAGVTLTLGAAATLQMD